MNHGTAAVDSNNIDDDDNINEDIVMAMIMDVRAPARSSRGKVQKSLSRRGHLSCNISYLFFSPSLYI